MAKKVKAKKTQWFILYVFYNSYKKKLPLTS
jgi:hypothetical protein